MIESGSASNLEVLINEEDESSIQISLDDIKNEKEEENKNIKLVISADIHKQIQEKINTTYVKDIDDSIAARYTCRKTGHILEVVSQVLSLGSTILAFSAGFYDIKILSFIAGCLGSLSLATLKTSAFALKESKERTASLNKLLTRLNMGTIPEIVEDATD